MNTKLRSAPVEKSNGPRQTPRLHSLPEAFTGALQHHRAAGIPLTPALITALQSTQGNQVVQRLVAELSRPEGQLSIELQAHSNIPKPSVQRVGVGQNPPTVEDQLTERLEQVAKEAGITEQMLFTKFSALLRSQLDLPLPHQVPTTLDDAILAAIREQLDRGAEIANIFQFRGFVTTSAVAKLPDPATMISKLVPRLGALLADFEADAEREIYINPATNPDPELLGLVRATSPGGKQLKGAAKTYLENVRRPKIEELSARDKGRMIDALERMPVVDLMYRGELTKASDEGANLLTGIDPKPGTEVTAELIDRIGKAMLILGAMVDGKRLPPSKRVPHIELNPGKTTEVEREKGLFRRKVKEKVVEPFRASADRNYKAVRIAALEDIETIVHEFGHQIEYFLPVEDWLDIQDLLRMRDKGGKLVEIYKGNREEAAFNAEMPATGKYSAKVYDDGSTEVMSMTLEYFSKPASAKHMIRNDPLQSAIILRLIKEAEFNAAVPADLRSLLPRGDTSVVGLAALGS